MFARRFPLRRLGLESLERREVLSGNVTVAVNNGNLIVTGDDSNNSILITRGTTGQVLVIGGTEGTPGTETQINGGLGIGVFTGVTLDILIDMRAGDDDVVITDLDIAGVTNATLGAGNDTFSLQSRAVASIPFTRNDAVAVSYGKVTTGNSVIAFTNSGNDALNVYDVDINGDLIFYGDFGDDTFTQDGTTTADNFISRNVLIDMGWGDDTIVASRMTVRDSVLIYDGGATVGSDVTLTSLNIDRYLRAYLSIGEDNVVIRGSDNAANRLRTDDMVLFTGNGEDTVTVENGAFTNVTIDTGHGDEGNGFFGIQVRNLTVADMLWINSGEGFDNILVEDCTAGVLRVFSDGGSDGVIARRLDAVDAVFDLGDFGDVIGLYDSDYDRLVVGMFAGVDRIVIQALRVSGAVTFDGGDDEDFYTDLGGSSFQASNRVSIENVDE